MTLEAANLEVLPVTIWYDSSDGLQLLLLTLLPTPFVLSCELLWALFL